MSTDLKELGAARRVELDALLAQHGGTITPAQVVAFAKNPETALHGVFEWDDGEAAQKYREVQAARYIRAVARIIERPGTKPVRVRAFVSLPEEQGYRDINGVLEDPESRDALLRQALRELAAFRAKYKNLQELAAIFAAADFVAA